MTELLVDEITDEVHAQIMRELEANGVISDYDKEEIEDNEVTSKYNKEMYRAGMRMEEELDRIHPGLRARLAQETKDKKSRAMQDAENERKVEEEWAILSKPKDEQTADDIQCISNHNKVMNRAHRLRQEEFDREHPELLAKFAQEKKNKEAGAIRQAEIDRELKIEMEEYNAVLTAKRRQKQREKDAEDEAFAEARAGYRAEEKRNSYSGRIKKYFSRE